MRIDVDNVEPRNFDRGAVRVIKNFLPRTLFKELQELVMGGDFPWYYNLSTLTNLDDGNFPIFIMNGGLCYLSDKEKDKLNFLPFLKKCALSHFNGRAVFILRLLFQQQFHYVLKPYQFSVELFCLKPLQVQI